MNLLLFSNFHKDFPYSEKTTWVKYCYAFDGNWKPKNESLFLNVLEEEDNIYRFKKYYPKQTDLEFFKAMGQQCTEYYVYQSKLNTDYVGCSSYRRYLLMDQSRRDEKIIMPPNKDSCDMLSSEEQKEKALEYLQKTDVIINRPWTIDTSVENQYLMYELPEYWRLFKEAITKINPEYSKYLSWFDSNVCNYEGTYIMKNSYFKKMFSEYFQIMEHVWQNCSEVYPDKNKNQYNCSEPFPWRYPGFLNERFVPFFIHANQLKTTEVPLVLLN